MIGSISVAELTIMLLILLSTALWIAAIIHVVTYGPRNKYQKIIWVICIALTHGIGACIYFMYHYGFCSTPINDP